MKFLIDAQLPRRFAVWLTDAGHDALHTLDMPLKNQTPDREVVARAMQEGRVVVSKDDDFVQTFLLSSPLQKFAHVFFKPQALAAEFGRNENACVRSGRLGQLG